MTEDSLAGEQHILVIDDDERLRLLLRRFLEESGFRVTDVGSASDARKVLDGLAFDLLIVDIMMREKPDWNSSPTFARKCCSGTFPDGHGGNRAPDNRAGIRR